MRKLLPAILFALTLAAGTYASGTSITVNTSKTSLMAGEKQQFSATTSGSGRTSYFWTVSGIGCSGFGCGNINFGGLYTAPTGITSPLTVTVTATLSDSSASSSVTLTINPVSSGGGQTTVSISPPANSNLSTGASETFFATVFGNANTAVTWSVGGAGCGSICGNITSGGVYTAPTSVPRSLPVVITATSVATPSASASVTIQVTPVISVSIGPFVSQMTAGTQQQFSAVVTGTTNSNVTWSVSGATCGGSSCGTISPSGRYTAPIIPSTTSLPVTVKAASQADPSKFGVASVTVGPVIALSVSPAGLSLSVGSSQQYSVAVTGTTNTSVNWSVSGAGCSGTGCGIVGSIGGTTALYQAPSGIPSPATVTITATLVSDTTKTASTVATIVSTSNNRLYGPYAFLFKGSDSSGLYQAAGRFDADGNGNLVGIEDINCGAGIADPICASGPVSGRSFTGTYTINADGRGTITIPSSDPSSPYTYAIAIAPSNTKARFVESDDSNGIRGAGVIEPQSSTAFTPAVYNAGYAFSLSGVDSSGKPLAAIGAMAMFVKSGNPVVASGALDVNDNGVMSCYPSEVNFQVFCTSAGPAFQKFSGNYSLDATGRGTASFAILGFDGVKTDTSILNFSLYAVSPTEFFLLSMDDPGPSKNPVFAGQGMLQQLPTSSQPFQQGLTIISWSGFTPKTGAPQAAVGQISMDGFGGITNIVYDLNSGGTTTYGKLQGICSGPGSFCTYAFQPNGDYFLTANARNVGISLRAFPTGINSGFLLGGGSSVQVGEIRPQILPAYPLPFMFGSDLMVTPGASLLSGTGSLTPGVLNGVAGNQDESLAGGVPSFMPNLPFAGRYAPQTLPNGQGLMYLNSSYAPSVDFWVISRDKTVAIDVDPGATPDLLIFEH